MSFNTPWFNQQDPSFFNSLNKSKVAHVILTAESEDFADEVTQQWRDEGFNVVYVPFGNGGNDYATRIRMTGDSLGVGEQYAVVAFDEAAAAMLEVHVKPSTPRICAVVAYYPTAIPPPSTKFPPSVRVMVHLAGSTVGVRRHPEILGIQSKKTKTIRKNVEPGAGYGGCVKIGFKTYSYPTCAPGFAEHDVDEYDAVNERLAFSRSLNMVKRAFRIEEDLEMARDDIVGLVDDVQTDKVMQRTMPFGHVINAPTLVGGAGTQAMRYFYDDLFEPLPEGGKTTLLSRTTSGDRVVDELYMNFTHSVEMPWLLPSIPPTNRQIEIVVISIVTLRGGKLESEHVYWDQASVLFQAGLLNPKLALPDGMKKKGVKKLPIVGAEAARAVKRGSSRQMNLFNKSTGGAD
ncbi:hypothetical protein WHR41_04247 [Cladosporium halotolerans]|uniref:Dienelactone hydrolase n=1 Tax=Cladosporium halotolerans TaxID=1052096 RepID=A0AB34KT24_9PEZI